MKNGGSGSHRGFPSHEAGVIDPIFWFSDSLGLFAWNIFCGKNIVHRELQGGSPNWDIQNFTVHKW